MSEEKLREELGVEEEAEQEEEAQEEQEDQEEQTPTEDDWKAAQEEAAKANGWKPFEDFVKEGGNPKDWVPAEMFNVRGEFIGKLRQKDRELEQKVQERVQNVEKLYKAKLDELKAQQRKAVEEGDTEEYDRLDSEINELSKPATQNGGFTNPSLEEWNQNNPWVFENTPKAAYAKQVFAQEVSQGKKPEDALATVDAEVTKHFSEPSGKSVPASEKGKGSRGFKTKSKSLSMDDLTTEEKSLWNNFSEGWDGDESKFLKAVADARAAEGGK